MNKQQQAISIKIYTEYDEQEFVWDINSDGTGKLSDIRYEETLKFTHSILPESIIYIKAVSKNKLESITDDFFNNDYKSKEICKAYKIQDDPLRKSKKKFAIEQTVINTLKDLFYKELNDQLENPVGDDFKNIPYEIEVGTKKEFLEAIHCVYDIACCYEPKYQSIGNEMQIELVGVLEYEIVAPKQLHALINCIIKTFKYTPRLTWEYVDENDGRITSHTEVPDIIYFDRNLDKNNKTNYTERVALNKYNKLRELLGKYDPAGIEILEDTFLPMKNKENKRKVQNTTYNYQVKTTDKERDFSFVKEDYK